jgi:Xaa-Pro aminopeptidase
MLPLSHLRTRRREFLKRLKSPVLLFAGGYRARATPFGDYPFRADSNFLFFFTDPEPGSAALFDPGDGTVTLFLPERTLSVAMWEGSLPGFAEMQESTGADAVLGVSRLAEHVSRLVHGRKLHSVGVMDSRTTAVARELTGLPLDPFRPDAIAPEEVVDALAALRAVKREPEIAEIRRAAEVTREAFAEILGATRPGGTEQDLAGRVWGTYARHGAVPGYPVILSVRGEILHNLHHDHGLRDGDLLLVDTGAEVASGYGADVTRAWPVSGRFTPEQREIYGIVHRAYDASAAAVKPGARWRHVHNRSAETITDGLLDLGLLRGDRDGLLERGAHALFFPHGVGHLLGLDTHDLRIFGDRILYPGRDRSAVFGADMLRMDRDLEPGMVVTVEPGLYFSPDILRHPDFRERFADSVDFDLAENWLGANDGRGFGGVRLENDLLVTESGSENLTPGIPMDPDELESLIGGGAPGASWA